VFQLNAASMTRQGSALTARSTLLNCLLALLFGGLSSLSLAPFDTWPVLFASYPMIVWLLDGVCMLHSSRRARFLSGFAVGWSFAFGYFVPSLWWISEAFWVEPEKFAALIPVAVGGLPAYLSIYWGLACGVATLLWVTGWPRVLLLAALIGSCEWLRGYLLTGFPWNLPGYGVSSLDGFAQTASVVGINGLTVFTILIAAAPAALWQVDRRMLVRADIMFLCIVLSLTAGLAIWGSSSIAVYDLASSKGADNALLVRIIQPNISQTAKWNPERATEIIDTYLTLTTVPYANLSKSPPLIVWPESALPRLLGEEDVLRAEIVASLPSGSSLLTGGLHRVMDANGKQSIYNSLLAISTDGRIAARHDKIRLVPFGEFLPFSWLLEPLGLRQIVKLPPGFSAGTLDRTISLPGIPAFVGFICYEAVFPKGVPYEVRPRMLVNSTNDAWFGTSSGPHQHLSHARFRAIEQGVPMVRAANTGISAMIDAHGRITASLGLGKLGTLDAELPRALNATVYSRFGDFSFLALLFLLGSIYLICRRINMY